MSNLHLVPNSKSNKKDQAPEVNALRALHKLVADDMAQTNACIVEEMRSEIPLIPELAGYLIAAGGKRVRPLLNLATARLFNYEGDKHIYLATAIEFIHSATLLHDDVVDESDQRRGQDSANVAFGNQSSVLVGDFLFSRAFDLMVKTEDIYILEVLSKASCTITEGEVLQLSKTRDLDLTLDEYKRVVEGKTAALFRAACESAALLAKTDTANVEALRDYGEAIGIAFQIIDDVLDYASRSDVLGKNIGDDFREGKVTLPIVFAYKQANEEERVFWQRTLVESDIQEGDFDHASKILKDHGALEDSIRMAQDYRDKAVKALDDLKGHVHQPTLQQLKGLADYIVSRVY